MGAVHVGIGHDDDLVVAQLCDVKVFVDAGSERGYHGFYLRVAVDLVKPCLLHIENFSTQGKNGLGVPGPGGLGGTSGRVSLYNVDLAFSGSLLEQSASFPGRAMPSRAVFLLVKSLAFLAAALALWARIDFSHMALATDGFCSKK